MVNINSKDSSMEDGMPDKCDDCERSYFIIYSVPNNIWAKIAPKPETLSESTGNYFGGILCPDCAARKARNIGVTLRFEAREDWDRNEIIKLREALEWIEVRANGMIDSENGDVWFDVWKKAKQALNCGKNKTDTEG